MNTWDDWGLTPRGFRRPSYPELLDAFEYKARELFPARTNLTVRSPLGLMLRIFAWFTSLLFGVPNDEPANLVGPTGELGLLEGEGEGEDEGTEKLLAAAVEP